MAAFESEMDGINEVIPESLNLHATIPTQTAIKNTRFMFLSPRSALEKQGTIPFRITSGLNQCIDPYNIYFFIECKITTKAGNDIPATRVPDGGAAAVHNEGSEAILINGLGHALIKKIKVRLNGSDITFDGNMYSYRGDIECKLGYPGHTKKFIDLCGFDEEDENPFDNYADAAALAYPTADVGLSSAIRRRYARGKGSKAMKFLSRIYTEICGQPKFLPPNSILDFEFERNDDNFLLMTKRPDKNFSLKVLDCKLLVKMCELDEEVTHDIERVSLTKSSIYPVRRVRMMYYSNGVNVQDLSNFSLLTGETNELPRKIYVMMVRESSMHGDMNRDPFNYQSFGLSEFCLRVGGQEMPYPSLGCNVEERDVLFPLFSLLTATNTLFEENNIGINTRNYKTRNVILGFDLTGSQIPAGECFEMSDEKNIELILKLRAPVNHVVNVIVYAEYDAVIEIKPDRTVMCHNYA